MTLARQQGSNTKRLSCPGLSMASLSSIVCRVWPSVPKDAEILAQLDVTLPKASQNELKFHISYSSSAAPSTTQRAQNASHWWCWEPLISKLLPRRLFWVIPQTTEPRALSALDAHFTQALASCSRVFVMPCGLSAIRHLHKQQVKPKSPKGASRISWMCSISFA